jgi:hypothetical protein
MRELELPDVCRGCDGDEKAAALKDDEGANFAPGGANSGEAGKD